MLSAWDTPVSELRMNLLQSCWSFELQEGFLTAMRPFDRISNPRQIRHRLRMNQQEFWARIGVTQSGGSRYESGRKMPKPVRELLRLVHIEGIELSNARGDDIKVATLLKKDKPGLYRSLRKAASQKTNGRQRQARVG
jgi:DNA-binding transcriptional regulator YiaG